MAEQFRAGMFEVMPIAGIDIDSKTRAACWRCAPLSVDDPDRAACLCQAEVPMHQALLLLLEAEPAEPFARLGVLRQKLALATSVREHLGREARYQDRWDRQHAADLRATARRYDHEAGRIAREISRLTPAATAESSPPAPAPTRRCPSNRSRRSRRASRPAPRRSSGSRRGGGGDTGGDPPPPGDPDPGPTLTSPTPPRIETASSQAPPGPSSVFMPAVEVPVRRWPPVAPFARASRLSILENGFSPDERAPAHSTLSSPPPSTPSGLPTLGASRLDLNCRRPR